MRTAQITRKTGETDIFLKLELDGTGVSDCRTGCGFLDHMLTLFARHGRFDLTVTCTGDTDVDYHHTVEDIGICLGKAFSQAMGDKKGIIRYGDTALPMDESLILSAVDISGRGGCYYALTPPAQKVGDFLNGIPSEGPGNSSLPLPGMRASPCTCASWQAATPTTFWRAPSNPWPEA